MPLYRGYACQFPLSLRLAPRSPPIPSAALDDDSSRTPSPLYTPLAQLLLVYHLNRQLGIPDELFTFGDDVVLAVLGQLAFMPTLVLAARLCPPGVEGTLFALLMSIFNGGGILGSELGALLTRILGVTEVDFRNLGLLIALCNLSSLLPLPFLKWIDAVETEVDDTSKEGGAA